MVGVISIARSYSGSGSSKDGKSVEWIAAKTALVEAHQLAAAENIVPWFQNSMPRAYFKQVSDEKINHHLRAMCALKVTTENHTPELTLSSNSKDEVTYIRPNHEKGMLVNFLKDIEKKGYAPLHAVKGFSSNDGGFVMNIFNFDRVNFVNETETERAGMRTIQEYVEQLLAGEYEGQEGHAQNLDLFKGEKLTEFIDVCSADYIAISDPRRWCLQREMYDAVVKTEDVVITTDYLSEADENTRMVTIAATNILPEHILLRVAQQLATFNINIKQLHVDTLVKGDRLLKYDENPTDVVVMVRMLLDQCDELPTFDCGTKYTMENVVSSLGHCKFVDPFVIHLFENYMDVLGADCLQSAELISALINASRGPLGNIDRWAYAGTRIQDLVIGNLGLASKVAALFLARFDPKNPMDEDEFLKQAEELKAHFKLRALDDETATILNYFVDFVTNVRATNMFNEKRYSLSMQLNPKIMHVNDEEPRPEPYGVYYVHGRRFDGFHVRFRDIARGGLRMVTPDIRKYEAEAYKHYNENFNLAWAQQLKNKDIPEGGSKGVVLVRPSPTEQSNSILTRKCVKAFNDGLLDLIGGDDVQDLIVRRDGGVKDTLYLGPDENIIPEDIAWMTERAKKRNYFNGNAYISSKATNGINHKDYGVTSEGVNVFMEVALNRVLGINPKTTPFTVKLTGGPDGDVAGNMIKIMNREYGDNVKVVAIADGFGAAEDPNGLDMTELLRLFKEARSIVDYNPALVDNETSFVHDASTSQGAFARNTMHNRVEADVFVPGGGRPETIGEGNYKAFLKEDGTPSSSLIVEGANLFLTKEARSDLFGHGATIVKDSSANKCGVIVSSYEIISAMLMYDEEEFVNNKEDIVDDVQVKIKELARLEANLLLDESDKDKTQQLPDLSLRISNAIIKVSDAVHKEIENADFSDFDDILHAHLPSKIAEIAFDRIHDRVPRPYLRNIIAKRLGTTLVYREGLAYAEQHEGTDLANKAIKFGSASKVYDQLLEDADSKDPAVQQIWKADVTSMLLGSSPRLIVESLQKPK